MSYPSTNEDYLKALEEAYRQGAAAAAQMALQEQSIHSRASCPDFGGNVMAPNHNTKTPKASTVNTNNDHHNSTLLSLTVPDPLLHQPQHLLPHQEQQLHFSMPPPTTQANIHSADLAPAISQHRSFSMPDMSIYASQKQEDIKRHKRLARNRASARLRRLRKKHLVDEYETEVKSLEKNVRQLKEHEWGTDEKDPQNLVCLLSMERGQEEMDDTQRREAITTLLSQQLQTVQQLQEVMQEQHVLYEVAQNDGNTCEFDELASLLELSEQQRNEIRLHADKWMEEWHALQLVEESLRHMQEKEWLSANGISEMAEQLHVLWNKNQLSKFLTWTDVNRDAVEWLNMVDAVPSNRNNDGPVFQFGVGGSLDESNVTTNSTSNHTSHELNF